VKYESHGCQTESVAVVQLRTDCRKHVSIFLALFSLPVPYYCSREALTADQPSLVAAKRHRREISGNCIASKIVTFSNPLVSEEL